MIDFLSYATHSSQFAVSIAFFALGIAALAYRRTL